MSLWRALALGATLTLGNATTAQAKTSVFVLPPSGQATFADVRIAAYNIREDKPAGADAKATRTLTAAIRVYFRDDRRKNLALRARVGTQFTASGQHYEVTAIEPTRGVTFTVR